MLACVSSFTLIFEKLKDSASDVFSSAALLVIFGQPWTWRTSSRSERCGKSTFTSLKKSTWTSCKNMDKQLEIQIKLYLDLDNKNIRKRPGNQPSVLMIFLEVRAERRFKKHGFCHLSVCRPWGLDAWFTAENAKKCAFAIAKIQLSSKSGPEKTERRQKLESKRGRTKGKIRGFRGGEGWDGSSCGLCTQRHEKAAKVSHSTTHG